jgi:DNA-binding NtrC family response regulator
LQVSGPRRILAQAPSWLVLTKAFLMTTLERTRLLCVDDEQLVLSALTRLFRVDCDVVTATSGEEALRLAAQSHFHVVISDQRMPGMKGVDLLRQIKEVAPRSMRILLTGYSDLGAIVNSVNEGEVFRYITKPWKNDALRQTVALAAKAAMNTEAELLHLQPGAAPTPTSAAAPALTEFVVVPDATAPVAQAAGAAAPDTTAIDVLLIDSDDEALQLVREACDDGRQVHRAVSMDGAIQALEQHERIGVIISEVHIGADDVTQLLGALKRHHPSIVTIVASGYSDANVIIKLINQGQIFRFIGKPMRVDRVRAAVQLASKLHRSMQRYSSLATRHAVDDEVTPSGFADSRSAPRSSQFPAASTTMQYGQLPPLKPTVSAGLLSRIANLFRRR